MPKLEDGAVRRRAPIRTSITTRLTDRTLIQPAYEARSASLDGHAAPATTLVTCQIYDSKWMLQLEAIAMA